MVGHRRTHENLCSPASTPGPSESWAHLYEEYGQGVRQYFTAHLNCPHDVDDLTQTVFVRLMDRKHIPEDPRPYIYIVARNLLCSYWRERKRRAMQATLSASEVDDLVLHMPLDVDPSECLQKNEEHRMIAQAMKALPSPLGEALRLKIVEGLTLSEAARAVGCSCEAMKKRLRRARRRLLECYRQMVELGAPGGK